MQVTRQLAGVEAQLATAIETFLDHHSQAGHSHGESNAVCLIVCLSVLLSVCFPVCLLVHLLLTLGTKLFHPFVSYC